MREEPLERGRSDEALDRRSRTCDDDLRTRAFDELAVLDTRWARGLAGAAVQALGNVILESRRVRAEAVLPHSLHEPDAPARGVHLDAEDRERWTGRQAETAVHACGDQVLRGGVRVRVGERQRRAHANAVRPGSRTPA